jgi:hypothetical protein
MAARTLLGLILLLATLSARGADPRLVRDGVEFSVSVRTADQLVAFYSARGFPPDTVREITKSCFVSVGLRNQRSDVLWLELANWRFEDAEGRPVPRVTREEWEKTWQRVNTPLASQATFGWTQLPETRDLQPGEPVGGNVAVRPSKEPFTLVARFRTGADGQGTPVEIRWPGLVCSSAGAGQ